MVSRGASLRFRWFIQCVSLMVAISFLHAADKTTTWYRQSGGKDTLTGQTFTASATDTCGVLVINNGVFVLSSSTVKKTGNTSDTDSSSFFGRNSGVLAKSGSTITLTNCSITTNGSGSNGVFATGSGSSVVLTNDTITCTATASHGVDATLTGTMTLTNVVINTAGSGASAAISTDRGNGTITATNVTATTTGTNSPAIYSTGTISASSSTLKAKNSEGIVIEGLNTVIVTNTSLTGEGGFGGALIYQSESGDASTGTGDFTMIGGTFTATSGPLLFITNTSAVVKLSDVVLSASSDTLVRAIATSRWGTAGKNGGTIVLTDSAQTMSGIIAIDSLSSITLNLKSSSTYTGAINAANTASAVTIGLDTSSVWTATGTSYVSKLTTTKSDTSTLRNYINANSGVSIYYIKASNSWLGGKTYKLTSGGYLLPVGTTAATEKSATTLPASWSLAQNYPNPFNPSTSICYQMPSSGHVSLKVYNLLGKEVADLVDGIKAAGTYTASFNGYQLSSGVYFYVLRSGSYTATKKMLLVK